MTSIVNMGMAGAVGSGGAQRTGRSGAPSWSAWIAAAFVLCGLVQAPRAAEEPVLDRWPSELATDKPALQRGAKLFANYCLNCHSASLMRWNRLVEIGLDEDQIRSQLIFGDQKVVDTMTVAMQPRDAKLWFGKSPPDLSVIIRARNTEEHRGTDYVYSLLRGFYRDSSTLTGWNNVVYPKIAMPNILWQRQGERTATFTRTEYEETPGADGKAGAPHLVRTVSVFDAQGEETTTKTDLDHGSPGVEVAFTAADPKAAAATDADVADLVAFLNWMSEPTAGTRYRIGVWVMGFMVVFILVGRWLNAVFWRDIK